MKRSTKIVLAVAGILAGASIYIGYQFYKNRPTLGNEIYKEAVQVQEKYRKLKDQKAQIQNAQNLVKAMASQLGGERISDKNNDFTQPSELEKKVFNNLKKVAGLETEYEAEPNESYKDPVGDLYLQRDSFKKEDNAINAVKKLRDKGFEANYFMKDNFYVVYLGPLNGIDDVLAAENKFYSSYPTKYLLLKGPVDTDELGKEKENNLVRMSLTKFSGCMKKKNEDCINKYSFRFDDILIGQDDERISLGIFLDEECSLKKFQIIPTRISISSAYSEEPSKNGRFHFNVDGIIDVEAANCPITESGMPQYNLEGGIDKKNQGTFRGSIKIKEKISLYVDFGTKGGYFIDGTPGM